MAAAIHDEGGHFDIGLNALRAIRVAWHCDVLGGEVP
jgi:hypothetical protein